MTVTFKYRLLFNELFNGSVLFLSCLAPTDAPGGSGQRLQDHVRFQDALLFHGKICRGESVRKERRGGRKK